MRTLAFLVVSALTLFRGALPEHWRAFSSWHPWPGLFIAILGFVGVLVPFFRDLSKIGRRERALWTAVMFTLVTLEIRSLKLAANDFENDRKEQNSRFGQIADGLQTTIRNNQTQFDATMQGMRTLAALASDNVKTVTGGDSFCYMVFNGDSDVPVIVHVGKYPLYGVVA
jgi:hypothetical protein